MLLNISRMGVYMCGGLIKLCLQEFFLAKTFSSWWCLAMHDLPLEYVFLIGTCKGYVHTNILINYPRIINHI